MVLDGNAISCDAVGCETRDDFTGELSSEDVLVRYHVLGWRYADSGDGERHFCPAHIIP